MNRTRFSSSAYTFAGIVCTLGLVAWAHAQQNEKSVPSRAEDAVPLKVGARVPNTTVKTLDGKDILLSAALDKKPAVVIFYRGGWCPFCNAHLSELAKTESDIRKRGYQIIAISPDLPEELNKTLEKDHLTYKLFSDSKAEAMKAFGVGYRLDDPTFTKYRDQYKIDLERSSGQNHHILPVPSVFVVNAKGKITFVYSNPDYKVRMKGQALLDALDGKSQ